MRRILTAFVAAEASGWQLQPQAQHKRGGDGVQQWPAGLWLVLSSAALRTVSLLRTTLSRLERLRLGTPSKGLSG